MSKSSVAVLSLGPDGMSIDVIGEPYTTVVIDGLRTVSEANSHAHWRQRHERAKTQRFVTERRMREKALPALTGPVTVRVTRIAPRSLDAHDNLRAALKHVVDGVADWLGGKDNDPRIEWMYGQTRGKPKQYAVKVEVFA